MNKTCAILGLTILAACGGPAWQKEGVSKEATEADAYSCRMEAREPIESRLQGAPPAGVAQPQGAAFETMADRECMRAKGYSAR